LQSAEPAMQSSQVQAVSLWERYRGGLDEETPGPAQPVPLDDNMVERSAQALFDFVFSCCGRLDGKHQWTTCDESTKEGFRREAATVILAAWPLLFR
jgi:hypothetical protein